MMSKASLNSTTNEVTFDAIKDSFDYWAVYDNNDGPSPNLVAQGNFELIH